MTIPKVRPWMIRALVGVPILSWLNINDIRHGRNKNAKLLARTQLGVVIFAVLETAGLVIFMIHSAMKSGIFGDRPELVLTFLFTGASVAILLMSAFTANSGVFRFRDYEQVAPLPASKAELVLSRIVLTLSYDVLIAFALIIPGAAVYQYHAGAGWWFWPMLIPAMVLVMFIPYVAGLMVGLLATNLARSRRHSQIYIAIAIMALLTPTIFYANSASRNVLQIAGAIGGAATTWYPPVRWLTSALAEGDAWLFVLFTAVSLATFTAAVAVASASFIRTNTSGDEGSPSSTRTRRRGKASTQIVARPVLQTLMMRELSRLTGSALYLVNSCFGLVVMVAGAIALPFVAPSQLESMLDIPGFADALSSYAPLVMSAVIATMGITASAISLEGRSLWLIKSVPVSERMVLWSKIALATAIVVPAVLIACIPLWITLRPSFLLGVLMATEPLTMALLMAEVGLLLNLMFPKIDWITEVEVVKQSMAVLATLAAGAALAALPFFAMRWVELSPSLYILAANGFYLALAAAAGYAINTWGVSRWNRIG